MKYLSEKEYLETIGPGKPKRQLPKDALPPFDFWEYFDRIPPADFHGQDCSECSVDYVWETDAGKFIHVLVNSKDKNIFMVLILDPESQTVLGHRLLNLNKEYGIKPN